MKLGVSASQIDDTQIIFTDAATSPTAEVAVGAFLCLSPGHIKQLSEGTAKIIAAKLTDKIEYRKYNSKKSTWSEIKIVLDALISLLEKSGPTLKVELYTDCQSVLDLLTGRKEKLVRNQFMTKTGKPFQHATLYKELFAVADQFQIQTYKMKGHGAHRLSVQEKIFALLDRLSRRRLRALVK